MGRLLIDSVKHQPEDVSAAQNWCVGSLPALRRSEAIRRRVDLRVYAVEEWYRRFHVISARTRTEQGEGFSCE